MTKISRPRDSASGLATGRRQYQPVSFSAKLDKSSPPPAGDSFSSAKPAAAKKPASTSHPVVSTRDPASGLPTGKRMHKPY